MAKAKQKPKQAGAERGSKAKGARAASKAESAAAVTFTLPKVPPRMKERYRSEVIPAMMRRFGYQNQMQVPTVTKVVLNMGVGEAIQDSKALEGAVKEMALVAGQRPAITRARKAIAGFKIRAKMAIGCKCTLRGDRMWEFLDRLFNIVLPRIRDFRGLSARSFDGRGHYSLGIREQVVFPELPLDQVERIRGMDIVICTSAKTDEEAMVVLALLGLPLREAV
jgi:large subunit ribosomal protein L5